MNWLTDHVEVIIFFAMAGLVLFALGYSFYLAKKRNEALMAYGIGRFGNSR